MQDITGAPEQQRNDMQTLLALTAKGSVTDVHRTWIATTADALQTAGLGVGAMGAVSENRDLLERFSMKNLRDKWFWSPAFFRLTLKLVADMPPPDRRPQTGLVVGEGEIDFDDYGRVLARFH